MKLLDDCLLQKKKWPDKNKSGFVFPNDIVRKKIFSLIDLKRKLFCLQLAYVSMCCPKVLISGVRRNL